MNPDAVQIGGVWWTLQSAIHHTGPNLQSGHYISYTRAPGGAGWLRISDETAAHAQLPLGFKDLYLLYLIRRPAPLVPTAPLPGNPTPAVSLSRTSITSTPTGPPPFNPPLSTVIRALTTQQLHPQAPRSAPASPPYLSWAQWATRHRTIPSASPSASFDPSVNARIFITRGDIAFLNVDAVVNAANAMLKKGGGLDNWIHKVAGPQLQPALSRDFPKGCDTGQAVTTAAFNLPFAKKLIHAVGPTYNEADQEQSATDLFAAYTSALTEALRHNCVSVALPCVSIGIYGYPGGDAADVASAAVRSFLHNLPQSSKFHVVFCLFSAGNELDYASALPKHFPLY